MGVTGDEQRLVLRRSGYPFDVARQTRQREVCRKMSEQMLVSLRNSVGETRLTVRGEVDLLTARTFDFELTCACGQAAHRVIVDLSKTEFLGAAGITALIDAWQLCNRCGLTFSVLNPNPQPLRTIQITEAALPVLWRTPSQNRQPLGQR